MKLEKLEAFKKVEGETNMLTQRQLKLLTYFCENPNLFISSSKLAHMQDVTSRTIKSDLTILKEYCEDFSFLSLESVKSKGTILKITEQDKFNAFLNSLSDKAINQEAYDEQNLRVKKIIFYLFSIPNDLSKHLLLEHFYISESTFYQDAKLIKKILNKYDLDLIYKRKSGYSIVGTEQNKRKCILNEHLFNVASYNPDDRGHIKYTTKLSEIVSTVLKKYDYSISDFFLQNLLVHIALMFHRMNMNQFIQDYNEVINIKGSVEYKIAQEIISQSLDKSVIRHFDLDFEVYYLATNILSKSELTENIVISEEINQFIDESLEKIKFKFGVDFTNESDFKNSIALHVAPLLLRIKLNMQLKSKLAKEIKQSFPVATNIATYFSQLIYEKFNLKVEGDEVSYLSSYFNFGLQYYSVMANAKNILIISSLRKSEIIYLKSKLETWFKNQVTNITIVDPQKIDVHLPNYDAILTTEELSSKYRGAAVKVNVFPNEHDFLKINLAINGFDSIKSIVCHFSKEIIFEGKVNSKEEIIDKLCNLAEKKYDLTQEFRNGIYSREELGNTFLGDFIAMPHPLTPNTNSTFVALGLLDEAIDWGENQFVKLVIMVSVEKDNPKSFQLWHYLSSLVSNEELIQDLMDDLTYEKFIDKLEQSLEDVF